MSACVTVTTAIKTALIPFTKNIAFAKKLSSFLLNSSITRLSGLYTLNPSIGVLISLTRTSHPLTRQINRFSSIHLCHVSIATLITIRSDDGPIRKYVLSGVLNTHTTVSAIIIVTMLPIKQYHTLVRVVVTAHFIAWMPVLDVPMPR